MGSIFSKFKRLDFSNTIRRAEDYIKAPTPRITNLNTIVVNPPPCSPVMPSPVSLSPAQSFRSHIGYQVTYDHYLEKVDQNIAIYSTALLMRMSYDSRKYSTVNWVLHCVVSCISDKILNDEHCSNCVWANRARISCSYFKRYEWMILGLLDHRLHIEVEEYDELKKDIF